MQQKFLILLLFLILSMVFLQYCGSSTSPEEGSTSNQNPDLVSKDIGPDGGELSSKDGKLTLEIPAGALGKMETINIEEISPNNLSSAFDTINVERAWKLGPDGLEFAVPVRVSIITDQQPMAGDSVTVQTQSVLSSGADGIAPLDSILIEANLDTEVVQIQALLSHFSYLQLIGPNGSGHSFYVNPGPPEKFVGDSWKIKWGVQDEKNVFPIFKERLSDHSQNPIRLNDPNVAGNDIPTGNEIEGESQFSEISAWHGSVTYNCFEEGTGTFAMESVWEEIAGFLPYDLKSRISQKINCKPVPKKSLTVNFTGNGTGNVTSSPEGIDCNTNDVSCTHDFEENTTVELTAAATGNSRFCGWDTGVDTEENPVVIVELDRDAEITACFEEQDTQTADISIHLTGPEDPVKPDEESNLEVTVKNNGPDDLPAGVTSIMLEFSEGVDYSLPEEDTLQCEESGNQFTCVPEGDEPFSAESEITFITRFTCQSSSDPCTITGEVQSTSADDPNPDNNKEQVEITVEEDGNSLNPEDIAGEWAYTLTVEESSCYAEDLAPAADISLIDEDNGTLEIAFDLILDPRVTGDVEQDGTFSGETPWIQTDDGLDYKFILEGTFTKNNQQFTFSGTMFNEIRDSETKETTCSRTYQADGEKTDE